MSICEYYVWVNGDVIGRFLDIKDATLFAEALFNKYFADNTLKVIIEKHVDDGMQRPEVEVNNGR